jgi:phage gpG-like protein
MSIEVTFLGAAKLEARLEKLEKIQATLTPVMLGIAVKLAKHIERDKLAGQVLHRRTGKLARSILGTMESNASSVDAIVGTKTEYARIQELGGTVTAGKTSQWLTIPLEAALTGAAVMKYPKARDYPNTFFKRGAASGGKNLILWQKLAANKIVSLFLLRKSVNIPARPYMKPSLQEMKAEIIERMNAGIREAMR